MRHGAAGPRGLRARDDSTHAARAAPQGRDGRERGPSASERSSVRDDFAGTTERRARRAPRTRRSRTKARIIVGELRPISRVYDICQVDLVRSTSEHTARTWRVQLDDLRRAARAVRARVRLHERERGERARENELIHPPNGAMEEPQTSLCRIRPCRLGEAQGQLAGRQGQLRGRGVRAGDGGWEAIISSKRVRAVEGRGASSSKQILSESRTRRAQ